MTVAPVEIPVTYSSNLLRKLFPLLGKVLKAIFEKAFSPSKNLKSPSQIHFESVKSFSFLLFNTYTNY